MPTVYQSCDAFSLPTRYEIFGMVLLEAMYYGLPTFTTYNGGSSTLMNQENGIIINSIDMIKLSKIIFLTGNLIMIYLGYALIIFVINFANIVGFIETIPFTIKVPLVFCFFSIENF